MGNANLVAEGLKFMVLGMTTVFLFLMLMIFVMNLVSSIVRRYFPSKKLKPLHVRNIQRNNPTVQSENDAEIVAVITASIEQFKKSK